MLVLNGARLEVRGLAVVEEARGNALGKHRLPDGVVHGRTAWERGRW